MTLSNWRFTLAYGIFFILMGGYHLAADHNVGVALGAVMVVLGICTLGFSLRTWRATRRSAAASQPRNDAAP